MNEQKVEIPGPNGILLEGLLGCGTTGRGVVVAHPHPLYGGDMTNNVVEAIAGVYQKKGHSTLRFNFRGVGASTGDYDDGIGEQADLVAAFQFLREKGLSSVDLAGYSFGAWVIAKATDKIPAEKIILVSPPVGMMPFEALSMLNLKLTVTGSRDDFAPVEKVKELTAAWNPLAAFEIITGADHFYFGQTHRLSDILHKYI